MGIGIDTWRQRIGTFSHHGACSSGVLTDLARRTRVTPRLACVIGLLLIVGGVELNPGPKQDDVSQRLDQLFKELRDTKATVLTKIDDSVKELSARLRTCEDLVTGYCTRLSNVERAQETMAMQIATLQASLNASAAPPTVTTTVPSSPLVLNDVVREIDLRAARKGNLVISGLRPSARDDAVAVSDLLRKELDITANVTHCVRLGKPTDDNHPRRLLVTLSSDADSSSAIRSAKKLRNSADAHVRDSVYINADLTPEQRKIDYNLRCELKRRRSAGEVNLIIRNGAIQIKKSRAADATPLAHPAVPATTAAPTVAPLAPAAAVITA